MGLSDSSLRAARQGAEKAAQEAARVIRAFADQRHQLDLRDKGTNELVTEADIAAQRVIVDHLGGLVPGASFLGEEESLGAAYTREGLCWIIDPIDGTTNFTRGVPPYAVSIGLVEDDRPLVGVVYDVAHDALFSAARGQGLTVNGAPAQVSATTSLADSLVATGFPYRHFDNVEAYLQTLRHFFAATRGIRRHGAASVDLAWVACGRFDAFFETGLSPWDVAAGIVLVEEGGGRCTAFDNATSPVFAGQMVATNGLLHAEMIAATSVLHQVDR